MLNGYTKTSNSRTSGQTKPNHGVTARIFKKSLHPNDINAVKYEAKLRGSRQQGATCIPSTITYDSAFRAPLSPVKIESASSEEESPAPNDFQACLRLLENKELFEECRLGMEGLMKIVNDELVGMKTQDSVSQALVYGLEIGCHSETKRLRRIFLSCFARKSFDFSDDGLFSDSSESGDSSISTNFHQDLSSLGPAHMAQLKLPALRVLTSSLNLFVMVEQNDCSVDLSSFFWVSILNSMSSFREVDQSNRLEAALSIKCMRLLHQLDPKPMNAYVRYSVLPYILQAHEYGRTRRDRMLVREASTVLEQVGIQT